MTLTKKLLLGIAGTTATFFVVLVVHIVLAARPKAYDNSSLELARIDFQEELDTTKAAYITSKLYAIEGIRNASLNYDNRNVVVLFDQKVVTADILLQQFSKKNKLAFQRFTPTQQDLAGGCPVIDKNSLSYQFSKTVQNIFYQ